MGFEFEKSNDLEIKEKRKKEPSNYSLFTYEEKENYREFYVMANKSKDRFLIPEQKQTDYFVMIKGNIPREEKFFFIKSLREINVVLAVFDIDPRQLKSKENLLF